MIWVQSRGNGNNRLSECSGAEAQVVAAGMAPRSAQPPRPQRSPRPAPRGEPGEAPPSLRRDDTKLTGMMATLEDRTRQEPAPPDSRQPLDDVRQRLVAQAKVGDVGHDEVNTVNYSTVNNTSFAAYNAHCEVDRREMGDINVVAKKRVPAPCPCPEDELVNQYELNRRRAADFRKVNLAHVGEDLDRLYGPPLDDRDQRGYCRMMAKLMGLDVSAGYKTPTHQRLRNRLVTEQTWYDLQAKMFLPPPVTNDRPITVVLGGLDKKRAKSAKKERTMWKQVGQFFLPPYYLKRQCVSDI